MSALQHGSFKVVRTLTSCLRTPKAADLRRLCVGEGKGGMGDTARSFAGRSCILYNLSSKGMQHPFQHAWWPVQPSPSPQIKKWEPDGVRESLENTDWHKNAVFRSRTLIFYYFSSSFCPSPYFSSIFLFFGVCGDTFQEAYCGQIWKLINAGLHNVRLFCRRWKATGIFF